MTARAARSHGKKLCKWHKLVKFRASRCTHPSPPLQQLVQRSPQPQMPIARALMIISPRRPRGNRRVHAMGVPSAARTPSVKTNIKRSRVHRVLRTHNRARPHPLCTTYRLHTRVPRTRVARPLSKRRVFPNPARSRASSVVRVATSHPRAARTLVPRASATLVVASATLHATTLFALLKVRQQRRRAPRLQMPLPQQAKAQRRC